MSPLSSLDTVSRLIDTVAKNAFIAIFLLGIVMLTPLIPFSISQSTQHNIGHFLSLFGLIGFLLKRIREKWLKPWLNSRRTSGKSSTTGRKTAAEKAPAKKTTAKKAPAKKTRAKRKP